MTGHRPFSELTKSFSPERKARVAARAQELKAAMALHELRRARARSQEDLARELKVGQPAIAKLERRADMYVSNLRRYVEALGGKLEIHSNVGTSLARWVDEMLEALNGCWSARRPERPPSHGGQRFTGWGR